MLSRSTPGSVRMAVRSFRPSITNSGQIRSCGVSTVSRTMSRIQPVRRSCGAGGGRPESHVVLGPVGSWRSSIG
jgi:hypothetical protein